MIALIKDHYDYSSAKIVVDYFFSAQRARKSPNGKIVKVRRKIENRKYKKIVQIKNRKKFKHNDFRW